MSFGYGGLLWRRLKPTPGCNAKEEEEEEEEEEELFWVSTSAKSDVKPQLTHTSDGSWVMSMNWQNNKWQEKP
jgi:hypothetical protein